MEPPARPSSLLLYKRLHLVATCCQAILWLVGAGAILSRLVVMSPLLPSYPGWSLSWIDVAHDCHRGCVYVPEPWQQDGGPSGEVCPL